MRGGSGGQTMPRQPTAQPKSIFVSIGNPYREEYEAILTRLMDTIQEAGLRPRVIDRTDYPIGRPLEHIANVMAECSGVVVVAFERSFFPSGTEKRGSKAATSVRERRYTTPWNHIEAALAYKQGLPLLVLAEEGVQREGLIEEGHDWYVEHFDLDEDPLTSRRIRTRIQEWARSVRDGVLSPKVPPALGPATTIREILLGLGVGTTLTLLGAAAAGVSAVFGAGVAVGRYFPLH